jgi:hypothetical protein
MSGYSSSVKARIFITKAWWLLSGFLLIGIQLLLPVSASATISAPLAAYSFDRGSGVNYFDEAGKGNDCINNNPTNITLNPGVNVQALVSNSSGVSLTCANKTLQPSTALTVMSWVRIDAGGFDSVSLAMPRNATSNSWALIPGNLNKYGASIITTGGSLSLTSGVAINASWHHLAMTYDGANAKLYLDGVLKTTQALTGTIDYGGNTNPLYMFNDPAAEDYLGGIDDARVYGSALSATEVQTMMNSPVPNFHSNTNGRSVVMSSSLPSATGVTYSAGFKVDQSYSLRTVVADFCSNSPREGQSCTAPAGFTVSGSPGISNFKINGAAPGGTWTGSSQNGGRTLLVTGSAGVNVTTGDIVTFDVTTVTNPSSVTSFFGRMFTYNFAAPSYTATSTDNFKESGGVALSTANGIGFIFQVPESLQFCVYKSACGDAPVVVLGHGVSGTIDTSQIDTDTAKFSLTTNAQSGVIVRAFGTPPKTPSHMLSAINGGNGVQAPMTAGTEAFGFKVSPTSGAIAATSAYADTGGNDFTFNSAAMTPPSTTGATLTQQGTPGIVNNAIFTVTFGATAGNTTPAGTYATSVILVATATF